MGIERTSRAPAVGVAGGDGAMVPQAFIWLVGKNNDKNGLQPLSIKRYKLLK
jgi:hypothetical protein